jgi:hypothetical protein
MTWLDPDIADSILNGKSCSRRCGNTEFQNFGHDDKDDVAFLSFPKVFIGNPFCRFAVCRHQPT